MKLKIDGEEYEVDKVRDNHGDLPTIEVGSMEFYLAESSEAAGKVVRQRWIDMRNHDPQEFRCMIGDERLIQWATGESDGFGISGFDDFLDTIEGVPEEELAGYDSAECEVSDCDEELIDELGFTPTVAYRHN